MMNYTLKLGTRIAFHMFNNFFSGICHGNKKLADEQWPRMASGLIQFVPPTWYGNLHCLSPDPLSWARSSFSTSSYSGSLHWNPANDTGCNILSSAVTWLTEWLSPALSSACSPTGFPPFNKVFYLASPSLHMCLMAVTWVTSWRVEALTHFIVKETEALGELEGLLLIIYFEQVRGGCPLIAPWRLSAFVSQLRGCYSVVHATF